MATIYCPTNPRARSIAPDSGNLLWHDTLQDNGFSYRRAISVPDRHPVHGETRYKRLVHTSKHRMNPGSYMLHCTEYVKYSGHMTSYDQQPLFPSRETLLVPPRCWPTYPR
ncbi:hypothetical protein LIA77_10993 [Sarocladium implicatum]|nr:hypothetical protein LIA77_10993 [Sarocladium implicatum]